MTSIFKKAVIISSGQIEIERPPPGLAFLAGMCEHVGLDYHPLDLNLYIKQTSTDKEWNTLLKATMVYPVIDQKILDIMNRKVSKFVDLVAEQQPDVIMISMLTFWQNSWCESLLQAIKDKGICAVRLVGGPGAGTEQQPNISFGRLMARKGLVDYWALGEGEKTVEAFLLGKQELGLNYVKQDTDNWAPQLDNLDKLPAPSYKRINVAKYKIYAHGGDISVTGSRGCVRRCSFCDVGVMWKKFRFRSADSIVKEIEQHYLDTGIKKFYFTDSLINGSLKTFIGILEGIVALKEKYPDLYDINYYGQFIIRPKKFHPESMYALMAASGYRHVQTGVESGSDSVRKHMGKDFTNEDVDYHMEMCNKYSLQNSILMMVGYPTETLEDFEQTLEMVRKYQKYIINDIIVDMSSQLPFTIFKYTPAWHMAQEMGIEKLDHYYDYTWISKNNPQLTVKERYRRYLEFHKLVVSLKYAECLDMEIELKSLIDNAKHLANEAKLRSKKIPILIKPIV